MKFPDKVALMWAWLGLLLIGGVLATAKATGALLPKGDDAPIDWNIEVGGGNHLTFVLVPPGGRPTKKNIAAVAGARRAFREFAKSHGYDFSTVGVALQTHPEVGVGILKKYGHFDELNVGRSWFNSGLKRYVKDMGARGSFPQVIAVLDTIQVAQRDWTQIGGVELARFFGWDALNEWEANGYPIPVEYGRR